MQLAFDVVVNLAGADFFVVVHAVKFPFVGAVGVVKDADGAVGGNGVDVVRGVRRAEGFEGSVVVGGVAACAEQDGEGTAHAGAVADDFVGVARHVGVVVFEVAHGGFEVDDGGGGFAVGAGAAARAGRGDDVAFGERGLHGVRPCFFAVATAAGNAGGGGHVAANLVRQEDGRGRGGVAVDAAAGVVGGGDVDVDGLVRGVHGFGDVGEVFVGAVGDGFAVDGGGLFTVLRRVEVEGGTAGEGGAAEGEGGDEGFMGHGWLLFVCARGQGIRPQMMPTVREAALRPSDTSQGLSAAGQSALHRSATGSFSHISNAPLRL